MRNRVWWIAPVALLSLSGCAYETERMRSAYEQDRYMAAQPFLNGSNFGAIVFVACLAAVLVIGVIVFAVAYVRSAKHAAAARIAVAKEKTRQVELGSE